MLLPPRAAYRMRRPRPLHRPARPCPGEPNRVPLKRSLTEAVALVLCCFCLGGCVSALTQKLGRTGSQPANQAKTGLIKPQMSSDEGAQSAAGRNKTSTVAQAQSASSGKTEATEESKASQARTGFSADKETTAQTKTADLRVKGVTSSLPANQAADESRPSTRDIQRSSRGRTSEPLKEPSGLPAGQAQSGSGKSGEPDSAKTSSGEKGNDEPPFQKHDHVKYLELIRAKAIDKMNKEKDVTLARLCRDSTTEEWTLTLYQRRQQYYSFASYVWDEIDGKWEKSLASDKRPVSGWKQHLDFSSAGKDCKVLKGSMTE